MKTIVQNTRPATAAVAGAAAERPVAPRVDLYTAIHRAIRLGCAEMLTRLGALDAGEDAEVHATTSALLALLGQLRAHVKHENTHVHAAMEARRPGSATQVAGEHEEHLASIEALEAEARALVALSASERALPALRLYRHFALFTAENLEHMHHEETAHNAVLWATYGDDELEAIHQTIVASQTPEAMAGWMHWLAAALPTADLAAMLVGARGGMPAEAFDGLMALVASRQSPERQRRLRVVMKEMAALAA